MQKKSELIIKLTKPVEVRSDIARYSGLMVMLLVLTFFAPGLTLAQNNTISKGGERTAQLNVIQSVLEDKLSQRDELRKQVETADADGLKELELALEELNAEIDEVRESFEQIAVGSVDLAIFSKQTEGFDWRTEMTQVMMPIIKNLQSLTEKPQKIEALKSQIKSNGELLTEATQALLGIQESIALSNAESTGQTLSDLKTTWIEKIQDLERSTEIANVKLDNLQNEDKDYFNSFKEGLFGFIAGRGLTLLLALLSALGVRYVAKFLIMALSSKAKGEAAKTYRTRQRVVRYGYTLLTAILMTIVVIIVFYIRGDVLLLGISFIIAGASLFALRHALPKFISEARLLLNVGSIREGERVIYNGLPYQVVSLNMYSILRNPELLGVIRLPLNSLLGMVSRPAGKEIWFPASKGDYIKLSDGNLLEVVELTTELIHLQNLTGTKTSIPATDFYNMTFENISRGENFSIIGTFGVGYAHQGISNENVPQKLQDSVTDALASTDFAQHVVSVAVELKEAGSSSLDYWVCVTMNKSAVRSYFKISRIVQQTCVDTCTEENWDIPFPQLTVHNQ